MLKKLTTLSMALLFPLMASAYNPKKEALLVGISEYQNGESLPGIELDIKRMKKLLESRGFHVRVLFNQTATLVNVTKAFKSYRNLSSSDSFFFYDSTHGTQVNDLNGDERDGFDEAYVLYDINTNINSNQGLLIDDQLNHLLSRISAKKVMMVDTCHSGTSYKSFRQKSKTKSLKVAKNFHFINKDGILGPVPQVKDLVVLSASQDNEKSIATDIGSLFTEAVYDAWSSNPNITFKEMQKSATQHIENICDKENDLVAFHPSLYSTDYSFVNDSIDGFLQVNIQLKPKKYLVEEYLDGLMKKENIGFLGLNSENYYNQGEHIVFNLNTRGKQGHLYILSSKESESEINVLYPNPYYQNSNEEWRGKFNFPNQNKPFAFQATNNTNGLERTVVYAILSKRIIPELEDSRGMGYNHFQSIFKDFKGQSNLKNAFKNIIIQRKANQISIAKKVFSVGM